MKQLILLRHAKSSWNDPALADFERPLNKRGRQNAPLIGRRLADRQCFPQRIISSPARRAGKTARLIAEELDYDKHCIDYEPHIYEADAMDLLDLVHSLDDALSEVMLVGHNPGLTDLANLLSVDVIVNLVTCGVVCMTFPVKSWQEINFHSGTVRFCDQPDMSSGR